MPDAKSKASLGISAEAKAMFDEIKDTLGYASSDEAIRALIALGKRDKARIANPSRAGDLDEISKMTAAINERAAAMVTASRLEADESVKTLTERTDAAEFALSQAQAREKELKAELAQAQARADLADQLKDQLAQAKSRIAEHESLVSQMSDYLALKEQLANATARAEAAESARDAMLAAIKAIGGKSDEQR